MGSSLLIHGALLSGIFALPAGARLLFPSTPAVQPDIRFAHASLAVRAQPLREEIQEWGLAEVEELPEELPVLNTLPVPAEPWEEEPELEWLDLWPTPLPETDLEVSYLPPKTPDEAMPTPEPAPLLDSTQLDSTLADSTQDPQSASLPETPPAPVASQCEQPLYPGRALRGGLEGTVVCLLTVDPDGRVSAVEVETSSGHACLDSAALKGLIGWRFQPGTRGGVAVEMVVRKRLVFLLPT